MTSPSNKQVTVLDTISNPIVFTGFIPPSLIELIETACNTLSVDYHSYHVVFVYDHCCRFLVQPTAFLFLFLFFNHGISMLYLPEFKNSWDNTNLNVFTTTH